MVRIEVQPPTQVQRGTALWPPLVVSCQSSEYTFYQIMLIDVGGNIANQSLRGTLSANPQPLHSSQAGSSSPAMEYAVFPDLSITKSGTYTLCVNAYRMDYDTIPPAWIHAATATSRMIRVRSSSVAAEPPSNSEATLLGMLRRGGFPIPY
ncbi:hypothetical protein F4861DRAFT_489441 [Xylaria intraflava]|nr:hypothetical protein F4861DRAFT_489441 [Xylaria intraflava]